MDETDVGRPEPPRPPTPVNDALTVVEQVYFHPTDREPRMVDSRWYRSLTTAGEQPYERYLKAGPEWRPLDVGWISEAGMVLIKNEEGIGVSRGRGPDRSTQPLPPDDPLTIEVRYEESREDDCFLIMPQESLRFQPSNAKALLLRCRGGTARYRLFIVPR